MKIPKTLIWRQYFQEKEQDNEIRNIEHQIKNLQSNLNHLFHNQTAERKKIAKQLQNSETSILKNLGIDKLILLFLNSN